MVSWEKAIEIISKAIKPIGDEEPISLNDSYGRYSSKPIKARIRIPQFPMALVDGFAVSDNSGKWEIIGEVKIGLKHEIHLQPGQCVRIATGGIVPKGTFAVIKIEDVDLTDSDIRGEVLFKGEIQKGKEFVEAGSDIKQDQIIIKKGQMIGFKEMTLLSAQGMPNVLVYRKPRIFLIVTGHEIKPPGIELEWGETYDSTSTMIKALLTSLGADVLEVIYVGEDVNAIRAAFGQSIPIADLIVTTGGTSVGKSDNVAKTIEMLGEIIFHGINVRPGKPMLFGRIEETPILGFPGFVTSSLVMAQILLPLVISKLYGIPMIKPETIQVPVGETIRGFKNWNRIVPGKIVDGEFFSTFKTSSALSSFADSQGYIHIKPDEEKVDKGQVKEFTYFLE